MFSSPVQTLTSTVVVFVLLRVAVLMTVLVRFLVITFVLVTVFLAGQQYLSPFLTSATLIGQRGHKFLDKS